MQQSAKSCGPAAEGWVWHRVERRRPTAEGDERHRHDYLASMSLFPDQPPPSPPAKPKLSAEERRARQEDRLKTIRLRMAIGRELDDRGITTPPQHTHRDRRSTRDAGAGRDQAADPTSMAGRRCGAAAGVTHEIGPGDQFPPEGRVLAQKRVIV